MRAEPRRRHNVPETTHGLAGRTPANATPEAKKLSAFSWLSEITVFSPENNTLRVTEKSLSSLRQLCAKIEERYGIPRTSCRRFLDSHPAFQGCKIVIRKRDHNVCPLCLDLDDQEEVLRQEAKHARSAEPTALPAVEQAAEPAAVEPQGIPAEPDISGQEENGETAAEQALAALWQCLASLRQEAGKKRLVIRTIEAEAQQQHAAP